MSSPKNLSKVTTKGQITLPKNIRDKLGIKPGDYIAITALDKEIILSTNLNPKDDLAREDKTEYKTVFTEDEGEKQIKKTPRTLMEIYDDAVLLTEKDRIRLIKFVLESIEKSEESSSPANLASLKSIGKGLWGTQKEVDKHIEKERGSWES